MAGRRHKHFRSGDLNEELGILLLKGFSAVAEVPRPEDVGIDAIATLLREGPDNLLIAENSFYVQLKSASERRIVYSEHEVRWLESLKLPFFIGSLHKDTASIELYATHRLTKVFLEAKYDEIHLLLDRQDESSNKPKVRLANISPPAVGLVGSGYSPGRVLGESLFGFEALP